MRATKPLATAFGLFLVMGGPAVGTPQSAPPPAPGAPVVDEAARDIAYDRSVLLNSQVEAEVRQVAAQRLLERYDEGTATALDPIKEAILGGDPVVMGTLLDVLRTRPAPIPDLLTPLVDALRTAPPAVRDRLALGIAQYGPAGLDRASALAMDATLPAAERIGAIHAMGSFATRDSGDRLIDLAHPRREEPAEVRAATFAALRRLFPADFGDDHDAWRQWWSVARLQSREQWLLEQRERDRSEIGQLRARLDAMNTRLVELLRDVYRGLPLEGQLERLPRDLDDPIADIRLSALDRISLLVRDSVPIPPGVRERVTARLEDPAPLVRARSARLLYELDDPAVAAQLAARLSAERDGGVVLAWLDVLALRPAPGSLDVLRPRLAPAASSEAAARAIVRMIEVDPATTDDPDLAADARAAFAAHPGPATARLAARLARDEDVAALAALLPGDRRELAAAVAEGFAAASRLEPLLEYATIESVYPHAVAALAAGPASIEAFRRLVALAPTEAHARDWDAAVRTLASRLPIETMPDADDVLAAATHVAPTLRETVLLAAALRGEPGAGRVEVLRRLIPMLAERGEHRRTWEVLEQVNGDAADPVLADFRFTAALRLALFEEALALRAEPSEWIDVLEVIIADDPAAAERVRDEIAGRFGGTLDETTAGRLEALGARIREARAAADPGSAGEGS